MVLPGMGLICCAQDCLCCAGPFSPQSILKITWEIEGPEPDPENCHCTEGWKKGVWYACVHGWATDIDETSILNYCATGLDTDPHPDSGQKWEGEVRLSDCDLDGKIRVRRECVEGEEWYAELVRFDPTASEGEQHKKIWAVCLPSEEGPDEDPAYRGGTPGCCPADKKCKGVDATEDNVLENDEWFSDLDCNASSDNKLNLKIEVTMNHCCLNGKECCFHPDTELEFEWEGENCFDDVPEETAVTYSKVVIPKITMKSCPECHCSTGSHDLIWSSRSPVRIEWISYGVIGGDCTTPSITTSDRYIFVRSAGKSDGGHLWEFRVSANDNCDGPSPDEAGESRCQGAYVGLDSWRQVRDGALPYTEGCDGVVMDAGVTLLRTGEGACSLGAGEKTIKATLTVLKNSCCKDLDASDPGACASDVAFCPCFVRNAMIPATNNCDLYP